ncbi:caspase family protein [Bradyrhizobium sp. 191]|uniref:caspase family protein n=1 Tax=Bradyrhizobium sp. 191 TaxID=2782659 RepID=UPI001FFF398E|nr:caspase family protein [Bradyrhizobium sp. 191]UPJ68591.1 caspase family protein [Bradyrhizobium sp. 191]
MTRKALIVGIDHYDYITPLTGAVNDAHSVKAMLERNADGSLNFEVRLITGTGPADIVDRQEFRDAIEQLFAADSGIEVALLYFAGHGHLEATGGYLCAGDCKTGHDGVPLGEIMTMAHLSKAQNKIIMLDSCHGGIAGSHPTHTSTAEISDGVTILTASTAEQYASESNGGGLFTSLLVDALGGEAANLMGEITPGAVYAHVDQSLGNWSTQRPVFKTNVKRFVSLRRVQPSLELSELRRIFDFFPAAGHHYQLDPTFEPERPTPPPGYVPPPDPKKTEIFAILQKYNRVGLLVPEGAPHMWHAAMEGKTVRLTALGEHYRRLVANNRI